MKTHKGKSVTLPINWSIDYYFVLYFAVNETHSVTLISEYDGYLFQFSGGQTLEQTAVVSAEELIAHVDSRKLFI